VSTPEESDVVLEASVVAGYVIAWALRKVRRVGSRLDAEADSAIDAGLDKLHEVVAAKLGTHPALDDLNEEAADEDGQVSELTRQQVELAITAAARKDDGFGQTVSDLTARIKAAEQRAGVSVLTGAGGRVFTGDAHADANNGAIAFGQVGGNVTMGGAAVHAQDPPTPGRPSH
jgi:hypothetical protein